MYSFIPSIPVVLDVLNRSKFVKREMCSFHSKHQIKKIQHEIKDTIFNIMIKTSKTYFEQTWHLVHRKIIPIFSVNIILGGLIIIIIILKLIRVRLFRH